MASVDWQKLKNITDVKRVLRHCDKDCRIQDNHDNEHINKKITKHNIQTCDYDTACKRFDERLEYLDSQPKQNHRPGRVLALGLEIPIPDEITNSQIREYTIKVNDIIKETTGVRTEDVIASYVHLDEVHAYKDSVTKQERTSMRHIHTYIIPELDDKLNAKVVCSRKNMIAFNNAVEEMCQKDYGCRFQTGEQTKSKESVERLKLESLKLELDERENVVEQREESVAQQEIDVEKRERSVEAREQAIAKRESETDIVYKAAYKKLSEADEKLSEATQREQAVAKREQSVNQAENSMTVKIAALQNRADELEAKELEYEQKMQQERKKMLQDVEQRERNFKHEVRKAAESLLERQTNATATLSDMEKLNNERAAMAFGSND